MISLSNVSCSVGLYFGLTMATYITLLYPRTVSTHGVVDLFTFLEALMNDSEERSPLTRTIMTSSCIFTGYGGICKSPTCHF